MPGQDEYQRGDRVEYIAAPVFDGIITTGDIGTVTRVEDGWVFAVWPRNGIHSVPLDHVRRVPPPHIRQVGRSGNDRIWAFLGEELPPLAGRERDPYMEQGCHPDIVERVWDKLGPVLPADCRAQAKGIPVLAHPANDRIFAAAHGTAYALYLTPDDYTAALGSGAQTVMRWSGGSTTDLRESIGPGWIWGRWYKQEPEWLLRTYQALSNGG